jgi:hypothetical protein
MSKRFLSYGLSLLLLYAAHPAPSALAAPAIQGGTTVEKLKADVARRAARKSRVTVRLQDGSKLKGRLTGAGADSFTVTDTKTGQGRTLTYSEVAEVKGQGMSKKAKIGIGLGVLAGAAAILTAVALDSLSDSIRGR